VILYRALSGRLPFEGRTTEEMQDLHQLAEPPEIPGTGDGLESIVRRCLAKAPEDWPESAGWLRSELVKAIEGLRAE